jgi:Aspartyl protease
MRSVFTCGSPIITVAFALCNAAAASARQIPSVEGALKISLMSGRPVVDGVYLNGQGPFRFLVDTGAQTNQVEASIARKLKLTSTFRTEIATATGNALAPGGRVAVVTLGSATAASQEFLFTSLDGVRTLSSTIQGVLGQEFLSHFDYLLDFSARRIVLGALAPEGGSRMDLNLVDGRPAVETDKGRLVIDSGTDMAILFVDSARKPGGRIVTAVGSTSVSETHDLKFRVGGRSYSTAAAAVPRASLQEDGIVPASLFHAIYVGNSGKYMILDPARSRTVVDDGKTSAQPLQGIHPPTPLQSRPLFGNAVSLGKPDARHGGFRPLRGNSHVAEPAL